jgi:hypothetical protein
MAALAAVMVCGAQTAGAVPISPHLLGTSDEAGAAVAGEAWGAVVELPSGSGSEARQPKTRNIQVDSRQQSQTLLLIRISSL